MSTQKAKFELFARLQALGFTYDEAASLRRIEMTLHRWAEAECNGEIERIESYDGKGFDKGDGKPMRVYRSDRTPTAHRYPIADREAGALYLVTNRELRKHCDRPSEGNLPIDQCYSRGLAVCC